MKSIFGVLFVCCALAPFISAAQSPVGTWKTMVPAEDGKLTPLKVDISEDGTYKVDFGADGTVETKGKYTIANGKITIEDTEGSDCKSQGVYQYKVDGDNFTMTRVNDGCVNRGGPEGVMSFTKG